MSELEWTLWAWKVLAAQLLRSEASLHQHLSDSKYISVCTPSLLEAKREQKAIYNATERNGSGWGGWGKNTAKKRETPLNCGIMRGNEILLKGGHVTLWSHWGDKYVRGFSRDKSPRPNWQQPQCRWAEEKKKRGKFRRIWRRQICIGPQITCLM